MDRFHCPSKQHVVSLSQSGASADCGGFLSRRRWSWVSRSDRVCFYESIGGQLKHSITIPGGRVVGVFELVVPEKAGPLLTLVFQTGSQTLVIVWSSALSSVLRSVKVPFAATCAAPVNGGLVTVTGLFSHAIVESFSGVIAMGCVGGRVLLLDMALDRQWVSVTMDTPRLCRVVSARADTLSRSWTEAINSCLHFCVDLTAEFIRNGQFKYFSAEGDLHDSYGEVSATSIVHVPQLCGLLVGYTFGGFQLFGLSQLDLLYSCPLAVAQPPVTQFAYQEPENDPRPFVYIWVCRGPTARSSQHRLMITLYQLAFNKRSGEAASGGFYQGLEGVVSRLQHYLSGSPSSSSTMLSCTTIVRYQKCKDAGDSASGRRQDVVTADRTLVTFIWQTPGGEKHQVMAAVFDLNQWYHAQMPSVVRLQRPSGVFGSCSYFSEYLVSDEEELVLGACPRSFSLFPSPPPVPESHLWPSALSFEASVLTPSALGLYVFHGVQRMVLEQICEFRASILNEPQRFLALCMNADLLQSSGDDCMDSLSLWAQQSALLSICLHYGLTAVLLVCARASLTAGCRCNSPAIIKWAELKITSIKDEANEFVENITAPTESYVDELTVTLCQRLNCQLRSLCLMLRVFSEDSDSIQSCVAQAEILAVEASHSSHMLQLMLWGLRNKLLPHTTAESSSSAFLFTADKLLRHYQQRRREENNDLLVDSLLVEARVRSNYPPTSLKFLLLFGPSMAQQGLILYLMCDLAQLHPKGSGLVESYSNLFKIPKRLKQCVRALWYLDQGDYQCAVTQLCQDSIEEIFSWQHKQIIVTLLRADKPSLALQYLAQVKVSSQPLEVMKLWIQALTAHGNVSAAFELVSQFEGVEDHYQLMVHLLTEALLSKHAGQLLQIALNSQQREKVCLFLDEIGTPASLGMELKLLLQNNQGVEAVLLAQRMQKLGMADPSGLQENLASGYSDVLPPVLQEMCSQELLNEIKRTEPDEVGMPQPLSKVFATAHASEFHSQASVIRAVAEKVAEARKMTAAPNLEVGFSSSLSHLKGQLPLSSTPFLSTPVSVQKSRQMRCSGAAMQPTPLQKSVSTPAMATPTKEMGHFLTHMHDFQSRMARLSETNQPDLDSMDIRTPALLRPVHSPGLAAPPMSILKTKREGLAMASRKIRFAAGLTPSPGLATVNTPLPSSDDSDLFYSPEGSLSRGRLSDVRGVGVRGSGGSDSMQEDSLELGPTSSTGVSLSPAPELPASHSNFTDSLNLGLSKIVPQDKDSAESKEVTEDDKEELTEDDKEELTEDDKEELTEDDKESSFVAEELEEGMDDAPTIGSSLMIGEEMEISLTSPSTQNSVCAVSSSQFSSLLSSHQLTPTRTHFAMATVSSPTITTPILQTPKIRTLVQTPSTLSRSTSKSTSGKPSLFSPVIQLDPRQTPISSLASSQQKAAVSTEIKADFSEVMVRFGDEKSYEFSKPKQVTDTPPVPATPQEGASKDVEPVFSPPLLRSASRQRKTAEFARLGLGQPEAATRPVDESLLLVTPPSDSSLSLSQKKRVRAHKPAQPVRRSSRLLRKK